MPGEPNFEQDGTWSLAGRTLTMTDSGGGDAEEFRVSRGPNSMTLILYTMADIDLDGNDEQVKVTLVFVK